jgi:hypothetical protein
MAKKCGNNLLVIDLKESSPSMDARVVPPSGHKLSKQDIRPNGSSLAF